MIDLVDARSWFPCFGWHYSSNAACLIRPRLCTTAAAAAATTTNNNNENNDNNTTNAINSK